MPSARYEEIVKLISECQCEEHLNAARALVQSYRAQRGGVSVTLYEETNTLIDMINEKQVELNKDYY